MIYKYARIEYYCYICRQSEKTYDMTNLARMIRKSQISPCRISKLVRKASEDPL